MCQYVKILEPIDYYAVKFVHDQLVQRLSLSKVRHTSLDLSSASQNIASKASRAVLVLNPPSLPPSKMDRSLGERVDNFHM